MHEAMRAERMCRPARGGLAPRLVGAPVLTFHRGLQFQQAETRDLGFWTPTPLHISCCQRGSGKADSPSRLEPPVPSSSNADHGSSAPSQQQPPQESTSNTTTTAIADSLVQQQQQQASAANGSSSNGGSNNSAPAPQPPSAAEEIDQQLSGVWDELKREMRKDLDPDTAKLLDSMSYDDLTGSNAMQFFKKLAASQLGPILSAMGLDVDPFEFLLEMIKLATFLQFITCGMLWFGSQSLGHMETGEAATATLGLALGYLSRPAFKIELLLYPVYNTLLQLFLPNATYMVPPSSREEVQGTLNRLGVTLALCFLLPQLLWGWDGLESATLVAPLCMGWFLFDLTYMAGLLLLLK